MKGLVSFVTGLLFALGLGVSGMTQTHVVKGFLDFFGAWNPNLAGVMVGAIAINGFAYFFVRRLNTPICDNQFYLPRTKMIDARLILGAALFGLGWGWAGICPGPGLVSLVSGQQEIMVFVLAMLCSMMIFKWREVNTR